MFFWLYFFCIMFAARCFDLEACFGTDVYDFNWARAFNLLLLRRRTLYICYDPWYMTIGDIIQGHLQTDYMTLINVSWSKDAMR